MFSLMFSESRAYGTGFVLVELALGLVVSLLLFGATWHGVHALREAIQRREVEQALSAATESLIRYAAARGHLPCPAHPHAVDARSVVAPGERRACSLGNALVAAGALPRDDLGVPAAALAGSALHYRVLADWADSDPEECRTASSAPPSICFATRGPALVLRQRSAADERPAGIAHDAVALVSVAPPSCDLAGLECTLDDPFMFVPRSVLLARLADAGRLP